MSDMNIKCTDPGIKEQIGSIFDKMSRLEGVIDEFNNKLIPVLKPATDENISMESNSINKGENSPLYYELKSISAMISNYTNDLMNIIDRVDL